jgi:hypothetical protein
LQVALAQGLEQANTSVAVAGCSFMSHGDQLVGDFGHGTNYDYRRLFAAAGDNFSDTLDGFGALDRSAAKLHYNHAPTACNPTAFMMACPVPILD